MAGVSDDPLAPVETEARPGRARVSQLVQRKRLMTSRFLFGPVIAVTIVTAWAMAAAGCGTERTAPTSEVVPVPTVRAGGVPPAQERRVSPTVEAVPTGGPGPAATAPTSPPTVAQLGPTGTAAAPRLPPATRTGVTPSARPPATATPTLLPPVPRPTPHPGNTGWVRERIEAVISLYEPTPAGRALLHSLDVRQMREEPGFFGSYGFHGWAGVGEAKPIPVMHELGHSYWGGFPVIGRPGLGRGNGDGDGISALLDAYHRDILPFMAQPPDDYEMLRQRLRNLPRLSAENTEPLFHSLEADVPYTTGGDLLLVPPILRKYWGYFLTEGPFGSWDNVAGWMQSLSGEKRHTAGQYLGFVHLDLRGYEGAAPYHLPGDRLSAARETLAGEEKQRLTDFAAHFDLLLGEARLEENFQFWRGYLRDKVALFRKHPDHLDKLGTGRASELSQALSALALLQGDPEERAAALAEMVADLPLLVNFLPALEDRTLVKLFASDPQLPEAPTLQATASFVDRLERFGGLVESVLAEGRVSSELGARTLQAFLDETGLEQEQDLRLFFDLLHGSDRDAARRTMSALDKQTVRALMVPTPVQMRAIFQPKGLLDKLDITTEAAPEDLERGLRLLVGETSGNFTIDEPFLEGLCSVLADRAANDPSGVAGIVAGAPVILERFIVLQPAAASSVLGADMERSADLVLGSDAVVAPPARIVYRLISADPELAADLVVELDRRGESLLVSESLAYFAYDKARSEKYPRLPISLSGDGAFLAALLRDQGADWLRSSLGETVDLYHGRIAAGEVAPDFLENYRETLLEAVSVSPGPREELAAIVSAAFRP